ncbi:hypothetical protein KIN20_001476 [Parelaphostrongylus tenuis]|uniref:Uncharacterized protein n=1 Tax=Parelaphostrongylus tenuis TaxID=148309 RepID=A0AAD5QG84_PARTN|nr:hypothetical protein KIN20_001476 [Parelaphostrongylus tenuis]
MLGKVLELWPRGIKGHALQLIQCESDGLTPIMLCKIKLKVRVRKAAKINTTFALGTTNRSDCSSSSEGYTSCQHEPHWERPLTLDKDAVRHQLEQQPNASAME